MMVKKTNSFTYDMPDGETISIDLGDSEPFSITEAGINYNYNYTLDTMNNTTGTITVDPLDVNTFTLGANGITGYDFKSIPPASITLGNTTINEKTLEKLLALLKFIESLDDNDEFKKGFNVFRAMDRLQK